MSEGNIINKIYLERAVYHYDFDLVTGIVENDIVDKNGINYTQKLGLTSPCSFDELIARSYSKAYLGAWHAADSKANTLSCENLRKAYEEGRHYVEVFIYLPNDDVYHRLTYYLIPDENGNPHAFVSAMDITEDEKSREIVYGNLHHDKSEIEDIIACANIGIWHICLFDGKKPTMKGSNTMLKLLGIEPESMTEEEIYEYWYSRIKKSAIPSVTASVEEMIEKGISENTYIWTHPDKGDCYVRCGGTSMKVEGKGVILRGYHSDVTDTVNAETKQKQLLEEALDEVKRQKKLLQEALDNYKEADYDRRRDFLTGLRNRQDMFEMLQDVLSGKRDKIKSMFMMDIDNFKMLNDNHGHTYGDECLERIGDALNDYAVKNDVYFYRYGGEEILGICFSDNKDAGDMANEIVRLISGLKIHRGDLPIGIVTISLGYTTDNSRYEKMIDKADTAMYKAKNDGKNRAVCYEDMDI